MGKITVSHVGKAYKQYNNRWGRLAEWLLPVSVSFHKQKWVLKDIDFSIEPGEAVGIIGVNGAGKSTLLKMITGTTVPTEGFIKLEGRVAALLELGMGFHPDFTGRQNAIMAGQLLGYTADDIQRLLPEIIEFAEIGDYIDLPVRVYSSGMQMRLAFSVATAHRPDILIVDEALSVGDTYFQHKSFERIRAFGEQGTTLLIVSHDKQAIQSICSRAILLHKGGLAFQGEPESVMDYYNALLADGQSQHIEQITQADGKVQTISGTGEAIVNEIVLLNECKQAVEVVEVGQEVTLRVKVKIKDDIDRLVLGYGIKDRLGQVIYGTNTDLKSMPLHNVKAGSEFIFDFTFPLNIGIGSYSIQTALTSTDTHLANNYEWKDRALVFTVVNNSKPIFSGLAWIDPEISILAK